MKTERRNLLKVVITITFLVMVIVTVVFIAVKESPSITSKTDSELYRPFIVFAPGFATLLQSGY